MDTKILKQLGLQICQLRLQHNKTIKEICTLYGVSESFWEQIENGKKFDLTLLQCLWIAHVFNRKIIFEFVENEVSHLNQQL